MQFTPDMDICRVMQEAIRQGVTQYRFSAGVYRVNAETVNVFAFDHRNHIEIDGDNAVLLFYGIVRPFVFSDCRHIRIKGIRIDWEEPPFTHAVILDNDGKRFLVDVPDSAGKPLKSFEAFTEFDPETKAPRRNGNDIYWDLDAIRHLSGNRYEITFKHRHEPAPPGTLAVLRHVLYDYDGFTFYHCADVSFTDVGIHCTAGMGVCGYDSDGFRFQKIRIAPPRGSDRLMSTVADGLHLMNCSGLVTVEDSEFAYTGDDAFNAHGFLLKVQEMDGDTFTVVHPRGYHLLPQVGDRVEITQPHTMSIKGTAGVRGAAQTDQGVSLTLDDLDCSVEQGDYIANASRNVELVFRRNIVRNKRCRGILVQTRNVLVEDNLFENNSGGGVLVYSEDFAFWESISARNVVIRRNRFRGNNFAQGRCEGDITVTVYTDGYALGAAGVHKDIVIMDNRIEDTGNCGIYIGCAENVRIQNNVIAAASNPTSAARNSGIQLQKSRNIVLQENAIIHNGDEHFQAVFQWPDAEGVTSGY